MKKTFYGKVVGVSEKSVNGYNKITISITNEYGYEKGNKRKQILIPTADVYKYSKVGRYKFVTEYQPEVIKCTEGYEQQYNPETKNDEYKKIEGEGYRNMPYKVYLKTEHWEETKEHMLEKYNHKCALCDRTDNLQVHHKTYDNKGEEKEDDLIVLCPICHMKEHTRIDILMHKRFDKEYSDCPISEAEQVEIEKLVKMGWAYRSMVPIGYHKTGRRKKTSVVIDDMNDY